MQTEADRCVKCGLCLPHCPTYALDQEEAESPRGRIALLQALASGQVQPDEAITTAIDDCLSCRACERVCPADVRYGQLFDAGQALLAAHAPARARQSRRMAMLLHRPALRRMAMRALFLLQRLGLLKMMQFLLASTRLGVALRRVPPLPWARRPLEGTPPPEGQVGLFTGCLGEGPDREAVRAAQQLLAAAGWRWHAPRTQDCCGALEQHGGDSHSAASAIQRNAAAFAGHAHIVSLASGCTAWLQDADDSADPRPFGGRLRSLWTMLQDAPEALHLAARPERIAIWLPCTQRNVLRDEQAMLAVLGTVPQADIAVLPTFDGCCGAAGLHFLQQPDRADRLAAPILQALQQRPVDRLLCANVGCRLHLASTLGEAGLSIPVEHPAQWLASSLR
ncbi:(Fe-S)-binding protein [Algiphilus sp. NNCM1]|uniref:(Fe-S)-binding protein n=1 Tax=Algiphilus sp. TaxID=1872431 RepID=UPI001CA7AC71|nr:(Fe-S)-binding protein [Algiphilus sp.]MBY8964653.1 (Fe-S)-binding protein [Algiphilus acroporae]MCI5061579.1 (Fe-S)-binding protein [Algiphilus sp.]MCI5103234.1 (Fe-S)-binding protein [Algiphilus sp.]